VPAAANSHPRALLGGGAAALVAVVAVVLALVLPGGGGTGGDTQGGTAKLAWTKTLESYRGTWTTASSVVVGGGATLTAYSTATGKTQWSWPAGTGNTICAMSRIPEDGIGVLIYGGTDPDLDAADCQYLEAVDLATGSPLWPRPLSLEDSDGRTSPFNDAAILAVGDGAVVAPTGANDDLIDVNLHTGAVNWRDDRFDHQTCEVESAAVFGTGAYVVTWCSKSDQVVITP
jgi:outer membrane protein assembly factor BamB